MNFRKLFAIGTAVAVLATSAFSVFAAEAEPDPGQGPEKDRENAKEAVVLYKDFADKAYDIYEAEEAEMLETARINADHEGFTGPGCVALTSWIIEGVKQIQYPGIKFTVESDIDGAKEIVVGYDNGHPWAQSTTLTVNGETSKLLFPTVNENNWDGPDTYGVIKTTVNLKAGENTISIQLMDDDNPTSFNIDFLGVVKPAGWETVVHTISLQIDNPVIQLVSVVATTEQTLDVSPMIKDDRTFIPVRGLFEAAGAEIGWNGDTRTVTVTLADQVIELTIDSKQAKVNGKRMILDVAPFIQNDRTFIPLRFISENLGFDVEWIAETRTVNVSL